MKVDYIDHMGSDLTVVNAARVSFNKESDWEWEDGDHFMIEHLSDKDKKLISYLAKHNHWTPFSHCMITMREKVPIFVARQRFKHMVGFTYNEVSRRYVDDTPEFYSPDVWRKRAENAKQGSSEEAIELNEHWKQSYNDFVEMCLVRYITMIEKGIAPEQARMVLPQSMYTEYYTSGSLAAWARAYKLRIDSHSQKEIQDLAKEWDKIIRPLFPASWSVLVD